MSSVSSVCLLFLCFQRLTSFCYFYIFFCQWSLFALPTALHDRPDVALRVPTRKCIVWFAILPLVKGSNQPYQGLLARGTQHNLQSLTLMWLYSDVPQCSGHCTPGDALTRITV